MELKFSDGGMVSIDCTTVEDDVVRNMYQRSELDCLIYNRPLEYAQMVLHGGLEKYVQSGPEHWLED